MSDPRHANVSQLLSDTAKFFAGFPTGLRATDPTALVRELDQLQQRALATAATLELVADRAGAYAGMLLDETDPE